MKFTSYRQGLSYPTTRPDVEHDDVDNNIPPVEEYTINILGKLKIFCSSCPVALDTSRATGPPQRQDNLTEMCQRRKPWHMQPHISELSVIQARILIPEKFGTEKFLCHATITLSTKLRCMIMLTSWLYVYTMGNSFHSACGSLDQKSAITALTRITRTGPPHFVYRSIQKDVRS